MAFHEVWAKPEVVSPRGSRRTKITENLRLFSFLQNEYASERELISALTASRDEMDTIQDKKILFRTSFQCQIVASPSTSPENSPSTLVWHPPSSSCNEVTCAICLEGYSSGQLVCASKKPSCNHIFHKDCMEGWMMNSPFCPLCRVDLMSSKTLQQGKKR